jgi:molecular chaperone DnaK
VVEVYAMLIQYIHTQALELCRNKAVKATLLMPDNCDEKITEAVERVRFLTDIPFHTVALSTACLFAFRLFKMGTQDEQKAIWEQQHPVLVYDFGATKLSVSCLYVQNNTPHLAATECDYNLGGQDFDNCVIRLIEKEASRQKCNFIYDEKNLFRVRKAAVQAKMDLSIREEVSVSIDLLYPEKDEESEITLSFDLTRKSFEQEAEFLFVRASEILNRVIRCAADNSNTKDWSTCIPIFTGGCVDIPRLLQDLKQKHNIQYHARNYCDAERVAVGGARALSFLSPIKDIQQREQNILREAKTDLQRRLREWDDQTRSHSFK